MDQKRPCRHTPNIYAALLFFSFSDDSDSRADWLFPPTDCSKITEQILRSKQHCI